MKIKLKQVTLSLPIILIAILIPLATFYLGFNVSTIINKKPNEEMETIPLNIDIESQLSAESIDLIKPIIEKYDLSFDSVVNEDFFIGNAVNAPDIDLLTNTGEIINLSTFKGPIVLEIIADWCTYCQEDTALFLEDRISTYPDITYIQYIYTGAEDQMNEFYKTAGIEIPEGVIVAYACDDFTSWLEGVEFKSFPTFYFFDENKKLCGCHIGADEANVFLATQEIALLSNFKTYEDFKTFDNEEMYKFLNKVKKAREYYESAQEIIVPSNRGEK